MNNNRCYCGSNTPYSNCCQPFHTQQFKPKTAEQLMRSRFCAFYLTNHQYLIDTHHLSRRTENELVDLQQGSQHTIWIQLTILNTHLGLEHHDAGLVTFSALFNEHGAFYELQEESSFIKENGQWYYLSGEPKTQKKEVKFKRNAPCWCHSGKKIKHCHNLP